MPVSRSGASFENAIFNKSILRNFSFWAQYYFYLAPLGRIWLHSKAKSVESRPPEKRIAN